MTNPTTQIKNIFVKPKRVCEKYTLTYDDGVTVHITRKEYERQLAQDKILKDKKKEEEKRAKACKPKRTFFRKKKICCTYEKDLTEEGIEPNPGPQIGIRTLCHSCGTVRFLIEFHKDQFIYTSNCVSCLYDAQSFEYAMEDFQEYKLKIARWLYHGDSFGKSFIGSYINIPTKYDVHINLVEDACLYLYNLLRSRNYADCTIATVNFCKLRGSRLNLLANLIEISDTLFKPQSFSDDLEFDIQSRLNYTAQANPFAELRAQLSIYEKVKELPLFKKMYKVFLYILCSGLLDSTHINFKSLKFDKFEAEALRRTHKPGMDMVHAIIDTVLFVCESGYEYFKTGELSAFMHSGSSYEKWLQTANKLKLQSRFLNNPAPHGFDRFTYLAELKDAIESGKAIVKFSTIEDKAERLYLQKILCELQLLDAEAVTMKSAQEPRKDPFGILLHGSSHIAKSKLTEILFKHYGKCFNLPIEDTYRYTRCPTDEYWSGFNSTQWCIVMDDIAFLKPNGTVDPTLNELLQVKNSVPYTPPQAALEDKGRTPVKAELLIATTNTKNLNLHAYFACPFAIARRLSYVVTPTVKKQYTKNGFMVDSTKIPPTPEGEYMDIWNFIISVPTPESEEAVDNQRTKYVVIEKFNDINSFLQWYISVAEAHATSQSKADKAAKSMHDVKVCMTCKRPEKFCLCNTRWPHRYEVSCTSCGEKRSKCECYQTQSMTEDLSPQFKLKLWLVHKVLYGGVLEFPQSVCDWYEKHFFLINGFILILPLIYPLHMLLLYFACYILYHCIIRCFIFYRWYCSYRYGFLWQYKLAFWICGNELDSYRFLFRVMGERIEHRRQRENKLYLFGKILSVPLVLIVLKKLWDTWLPKEDCEIKPVKLHCCECHSRECSVKCQSSETKCSYHEQGNIGMKPIDIGVEKKTFYYHDPYKVTPCEISSASKCAQGDNLLDIVRNQTARFNMKFVTLGRCMSTTAVNIHGNVWMLNKHAFKTTTGILDVMLDDASKNVSRNANGISFSEKDLKFIDGTDVALIQLRCMPPGKSVLKYFALDDRLEGRYKGKYILKSMAGINSIKDVCNIQPGVCPCFGIDSYHGRVVVPTDVGDCGSVCIAEVGNGQVILGSHISGAPDGGLYMQHISQKMLEIVKEYGPQVNEGTIPISAPGYERNLVDLHVKSTMRFLEEGTAKIYGSFSGYRPKHKSKVEPTLMKDYAVEHGYNASFGKPDMTWKPWHIAIKDMTTPVHVYLNENIVKCEDAFLQDILKGVGDKLHMIQVYDLDTALNGAEGITYVDKLNCSTSAGNPFKKSKKNFLTEVDGKITDVDPLILDRIHQIEQSYDNNTRFHPQFCGHLKDEPVSAKKMASGKTRVFTGGEMAWSIVVRKYLLSHIRLIQNNPFVFEAMPGVVAQSIEWQGLYEYLTPFGQDQIVAGDYGCFDKRMAAPFILSAFRILERLAEKAGWPDEDLRYIRCIAQDTAFPCIDFNGDLIEIQGNPSGHPLTVIINCIVNSLYMRYAFLLISGKPLEDFQKYVKLATYGDDNIMGVSKECPLFNHTRIAKAMECIGVKYTMAEKDAESVPYIHISQSSFLKRAFRYDDDIGAIVAPLDSTSFDKMLTYRLPKDDMASEAHAICVIETAQREYFFHGKEVFERKQEFFRKMVEDLDLGLWVRPSTFPKYYDLVYDFWMKYDDVQNARHFAKRD